MDYFFLTCLIYNIQIYCNFECGLDIEIHAKLDAFKTIVLNLKILQESDIL